MEKTIANRIKVILPNHSIRGIKQVSTKPGSSVFQIRLYSATLGNREIYAKKHGDNYSHQIHEMMELNQYHELFLMPKILDYHDGFIISEGVSGDTLTKSLLKYTPCIDKSPLIECSRKIGHAIGSLQHLTNRGTRRIGGLNIFLIREVESEDYFRQIIRKDLFENIIHQANELKELKTRLTQHHGDPSPHNILMRKDQVFLLDYSFQDNASFVDPCLYLVSLELMKNRLGPIMRNTISLMEKSFMEAYSEWTNETYDQPIWSTIKTLTYLHFLLMYATREKTIRKTLVSFIDRPYLLKRIKEYGKRSS